MASVNPFDLLGDDDNDDPSQLLAAQEHKLGPLAAKKPQAQPAAQPAKPAKLPSKPLPPAQAGELSASISILGFYCFFQNSFVWFRIFGFVDVVLVSFGLIYSVFVICVLWLDVGFLCCYAFWVEIW